MTGLLPIVIAKALVEVALLMLLGRGLLHVLLAADAPRREGNFVYRLFDLGTRPVLRFTRALLPRGFAARRLPWLAAALLMLVWCLLVLAKWQACQGQPGETACRFSTGRPH